MRYGPLDHPQTGVAVPVSALRSPGHGIGEFADLVGLADWAAGVGFELVQILPVQDTGDDPSPYAGMSALALHPVYLRIEDVEGSEGVLDTYLREQAPLAARARVDHAAVLASKLRALRAIFERRDGDRLAATVEAFAAERPWLSEHVAYRILKERHGGRPWTEWEEHRDPSPDDLPAILASDPDESRFQLWVQREADRQLRAVAEAMDARGVRLKGDIPILMHDDSADVWLHRHLFDREGRAGAPPDMYSDEGQYWSFPCYRWRAMADDDHAWWRRRLRHAARYFHALRIDHVLGFFRIWRIPSDRRTGRLGIFDPTVVLEREELNRRGLDDGFLDWIASPADTHDSRGASELEILEIDDPVERRRRLDENADRILLDVDGQGERFVPVWGWREKPLFGRIPDDRVDQLEEVLAENGLQCEALWEETGRRRLAMLADETEMLICAEDLGAVPDCVPPVLRELGVLGLRVERWCRDWDSPERSFVDPVHFDSLTVCSPGVHDASSLRGWWEEDEDERTLYWRQALGREGDPPDRLDGETLAAILARNLDAASRVCVLSMPDCLALDAALRPDDPRQERINTPGSESTANWDWRMPLAVEELGARTEWTRRLAALVARRAERAL